MCVCERSVWTLIAAQALMVRAQLCDSAEYWSPSNFSWSDPSQPARQYRTHTHTHTHTLTRVHSADFRSRSWNGTQVNTDRISKMHKLLVSALASDWLTGLIVSDWSVGASHLTENTFFKTFNLKYWTSVSKSSTPFLVCYFFSKRSDLNCTLGRQ